MARFSTAWAWPAVFAIVWGTSPLAASAKEISKSSYEESEESGLDAETIEPAQRPNYDDEEEADEPETDESSADSDDENATDAADDEAADDETADETADDDHAGHDHGDHDHADDESADNATADDNSDQSSADGPGEVVHPEEGSGEPELIQERYPNRAIRIEREVTQDSAGNYVNHGSWKMWDQRGNLVAEGEYLDGQRHGTWNRWFRAAEADLFSKAPYQQFVGPFISQATFDHGKLNGNWTIFDSKQRKISEWEFVDGQRHGKSLWWYANGQKMREIDYANGDIDGQLLEWSPDAQLTTRESYKGGRRLAPKVAHHSSSQKKSEGMYLHSKDVVKTPDDWWNVKLATYEKQGKDEKHGAWSAWYATGQKQMQGEYKNDAQVGKFTWWHQNGQKALEGSYDNGKQDGRWVWWHQNGQKSIQGQYARGNPTGHWTWWQEDGKVAQSADLSHSEGQVVELPTTPKEARRMPAGPPRARTRFMR